MKGSHEIMPRPRARRASQCGRSQGGGLLGECGPEVRDGYALPEPRGRGQEGTPKPREEGRPEGGLGGENRASIAKSPGLGMEGRPGGGEPFHLYSKP